MSLPTFSDIEQEAVIVLSHAVPGFIADGASVVWLYPPTHQKSRNAFAAWRDKTGR